VLVARSVKELEKMILAKLTEPDVEQSARQKFIQSMFSETLDGKAGGRVAQTLIHLAGKKNEK
jgi:hypothetical protein